MAIFLTTTGTAAARNTCIDPVFMITGGSEYTFGDGYTWCGPYTYGYGSGNVDTSLTCDGNGRWITWNGSVSSEHSRLETEQGSPPVALSTAELAQLPALPNTGSNQGAAGFYHKTNDSWIVTTGAFGGECETSTDYAESWTTQTMAVATVFNSGIASVAVTESGSTTLYHVQGDNTSITTDGGINWSANFSGLPSSQARTLSYNPFTDEMWVSMINGSVYTAARSNFMAGSGSWTAQVSGLGSAPRVDINTRTGTAIVTYRTGSNEWRSTRKPLGAGSFQDDILMETTSATQGDLCYSPAMNRIYAGCGNSLIRYSNDDGRSWQADENLTLPVGNGFRLMNQERFVMHDF